MFRYSTPQYDKILNFDHTETQFTGNALTDPQNYCIIVQYYYDTNSTLSKHCFKIYNVNPFESINYITFLGNDNKRHRLYKYKYKHAMFNRLFKNADYLGCIQEKYNKDKEYLFHNHAPCGYYE